MRSLDDVLAAWREAERQVEDAEEGTPERTAAEAQAERRREEYRRTFAEVESTIRRDGSHQAEFNTA